MNDIELLKSDLAHAVDRKKVAEQANIIMIVVFLVSLIIWVWAATHISQLSFKEGKDVVREEAVKLGIGEWRTQIIEGKVQSVEFNWVITQEQLEKVHGKKP